MSSVYRPQGFSLIAVLPWLLVLGSGIFLALNIVPPYKDFYTIKSVLQRMQEDPEISKEGRSELYSRIQKSFTINNLKYDAKKTIKIIRKNRQIRFEIDYEVREPLLQDIDILLHFVDRME